MNTLTTLPPPPAASAKNILSKNGYTCAIVSIGQGDELTIPLSATGEDHLLFVLDGEIAVRNGEINTMLNKNEAHLLPKEGDTTIVVTGGRRAKLLRVDVPPRQKVEAPIFTMSAEQPS